MKQVAVGKELSSSIFWCPEPNHINMNCERETRNEEVRRGQTKRMSQGRSSSGIIELTSKVIAKAFYYLMNLKTMNWKSLMALYEHQKPLKMPL